MNRSLLIATAVLEVAAGVLLLGFPSLAAVQLLGSPLDTPVESTVARLAGLALLALGCACWLARHDHQSGAARGLVGGMLVYNAGVVALLVYAGFGLRLPTGGLWPALFIHAVMTAWCVLALVYPSRQAIAARRPNA